MSLKRLSDLLTRGKRKRMGQFTVMPRDDGLRRLDCFDLRKPCACGSRRGVWTWDRRPACRRCGQEVTR